MPMNTSTSTSTIAKPQDSSATAPCVALPPPSMESSASVGMTSSINRQNDKIN